MVTSFQILWVALAALAWAGATAAQAQGPLTLEQAQQLAAGRSQQMVAQAALASAAREQAVAAGQLPDPVLKIGLNNLPVTGSERYTVTRDFMTMRSVGVAQEITRSEKRKTRSARFDRAAEAAEAGRLLALANLRRDTAQAWLERYYQERIREVLQTQRTEAGLQIDAADAAYRGGRGMQADVFAARSAAALIDQRILQTQGQIEIATTKLSRWVGEGAGQVLGAPPDLAAMPLAETTLADQLVHHPRLAAAAKQEEVARAEADIAQSSRQSDWNVELMFSQRGPAFSNMVSVNFSVPLQFDQKNRQDREVLARLALVEQLRAEREEATREHLAEARTWLQAWHSNRGRMAHYERTLVPLAAERTRAALASYRGGSGPLGTVLEARRMEIDTRLDRLRLEMETASLWAQLNVLLVPDHGSTVRRDSSAKTEQ